MILCFLFTAFLLHDLHTSKRVPPWGEPSLIGDWGDVAQGFILVYP